jgi:hypothetical protein
LSKSRMSLSAAILAVAALGIGGSVVYAGGGGGNGLATGAEDVGPATSATCNVGKQSFTSHGNGNSTTSTTYVNITGAAVTFNATARAKCITALFTSMAFAPSPRTVFVRALLDGSVVGEPADTQFTGDDGAIARSYAMNFAFPGVGPGTHTVQMQFRSFDGGAVFIHRGTTTVLYK